MPIRTAKAARKPATKRSDGDEALIEASLKRFKITADAESEVRELSLDDLRFSIAESQWPESIKASRDLEGKPCLTVNRMPTFLRQYTGEERQQRPAMLVDPVGSGSDPEVAEVIQGVLRHIETASFADTVYDVSYDWMLRTGWSYWRINNEYLSDEPGPNDDAFAQEPRIQLIENPFSIYMSPVRKPDGTDPLWCHALQDMSIDQYKEEYAGSKLASLSMLSSTGARASGWVTKRGIRIAEYWWLDLARKTLCLLSDGSTAFENELGGRTDIEDKREVVTRKVRCIKHNAIEVLARYEWLGKYIPLIPLDGTKLNVNGKIYKAGMIRDAKDPQRLYNIEITGCAEMIALAPKDPLYVAEGSLGNHEEEYRLANRKNFPYLYYKAYNEEGKQLPPPTRASREPPIEAMSKMIQQADYDMKSVIGIYEPGLGEQGPQESGIAILTRQQQSGISGINYSDNLNKSIRYQGRLLLDLWPKLITKARVQRIVNPDDSVKQAVVFNSQHSDQAEVDALLQQHEAIDKAYDVGTGNYDATLSTGPMYQTARKEAFAALTAVITAKPDLLSVLGDIWAKNADFPEARTLAERFKKMLPPNLQDEQGEPAAQLAALQSQLQQVLAQHNQLVAELERATDTIRTNRLQIESKERIANLQAWAGLVEQQVKTQGAAGLAHLQAVLTTIQDRMLTLHGNMSVEQDAGEPPPTPELPNKVEPHVLPITPAAPVAPVQPIPGQPGGVQ